MTDRPASAGLGPDEVVWTDVSPQLIPVLLIGTVITEVIWLAVLSIPLVLMLTGIWTGLPAVVTWLFWAAPAAALVYGVVRLILVPRRVRAMGYAEREDDLLIRSGLLFRRVAAVPYGRLQYLDVKEGPLRRRYGIRTLEFQTAAALTDVTLPGIPVQESERLREELLARGQARLAGL